MSLGLQSFIQDESGAISVEWVVLTAAIIGLQIVLLVGYIRSALIDTSVAVSNTISSYDQFLQ